MARGPAADSAETFDKIVSTAKRILTESGAGRLNLRQVASESGLSLGTVQYYFSSKDKLLASCLVDHEALIAGYIDGAQQALSTGTPLEDVLVTAVRAIFRHGREQPEFYRLRLFRVLDAKHDPDMAEERFLLRELEMTAGMFVTHLGIDRVQARLLAQTIAMSVVRYIAFDQRDLCRTAGVAEPIAALAAVEDHLAWLIRALLQSAREQRSGR